MGISKRTEEELYPKEVIMVDRPEKRFGQREVYAIIDELPDEKRRKLDAELQNELSQLFDEIEIKRMRLETEMRRENDRLYAEYMRNLDKYMRPYEKKIGKLLKEYSERYEQICKKYYEKAKKEIRN